MTDTPAKPLTAEEIDLLQRERGLDWYDIPRLLATIDALRAENARLESALHRECELNWTGSLCDRLNSFAREHGRSDSQCTDGPSASRLAQDLHAYAGSLKAENSRLAGVVERLPKTADGVMCPSGSAVYYRDGTLCLAENYEQNVIVGSTPSGLGSSICGIQYCYSTREAALAREGE